MKSFNEKCYEILKKVPKGKVTTYKDIALALNSKAYRAVGSAMKNNPFAPSVPCHRVIRSNGSVGEYNGGVKKKISLLESEGIKIINGKINLKEFGFEFKPKSI